MERSNTNLIKLFSTVCMVCLSSQLVLAQNAAAPVPTDAAKETELELPEVIVSASKRSFAIIDVPQSVQGISADTINRLGSATLQNAINQMPGVSGYATGTGRSKFNIRGVASFSNNVIDSSTVGFYLDEIPLSSASITPDLLMYDLDRIEVLRGPQGTLYGEGSLGGAIKLITRRPDFNEAYGEAYVDGSQTERGGFSYRGSAFFNAPILSNKVALRVVGTYLKDGGFIDDAISGKKDINSAEFYNIRAAVRAKPSDNTDIQLVYTRQKGIGGPDPLQATGLDLALRQGFQQSFSDRIDLLSFTGNVDLGAAELVYTAAYLNRRRTEVTDHVGTIASIESLLSGVFGVPIDFTKNNPGFAAAPEKTWTHEFRVLSTGDTALSWLVGGYFKDRKTGFLQTSDSEDIEDLFPGFSKVFLTDVNTRFREIAGFGEVSYQFTDKLKLTGGARLFRQTNKGTARSQVAAVDPDTGPYYANSGVIPISQTTKDVLFKTSLDYKATENMLVYVLFGQGVRGGGVNTRLYVPSIPRTYKADAVDSYELGFKLRALGGRFSLNSSIFQTNWKQMQVVVGPGLGVEYIVNDGKARSRGLEIEASYRPINVLTVGGSYALVDAKLTTAIERVAGNATDAPVIAPVGSPLAGVGKHKFNAYADVKMQMTKNLTGFFRIDAEYVGKIPVSLPSVQNGILTQPGTNLPGYLNGNIQFGVQFDTMEITAYVKNVTNKRALLDIAAPELDGFIISRPRVFGLSLRAEL